MEKIVITPEILMNATDAMPIMERQELLEKIAQDCIVRVRMSYIPTGESGAKPMPERYQEYRVNTNLYLMGVLANKYLHVPFGDTEDDLKMPADTYDNWNASHVLSQIEGFKSDKELREKSFNLLADYREFKNALYREIETLLGHNNDVVWRLIDAVSMTMRESVTQAAQKELEGMTDEQKEEQRQKIVSSLTEALDKLKGMKEKLEEVVPESAKPGADAE